MHSTARSPPTRDRPRDRAAFAREELRPVALAYDESGGVPREILRKAAALGLTCYDLPAEVGGGGLERLPRPLRGDRGADLG